MFYWIWTNIMNTWRRPSLIELSVQETTRRTWKVRAGTCGNACCAASWSSANAAPGITWRAGILRPRRTTSVHFAARATPPRTAYRTTWPCITRGKWSIIDAHNNDFICSILNTLWNPKMFIAYDFVCLKTWASTWNWWTRVTRTTGAVSSVRRLCVGGAGWRTTWSLDTWAVAECTHVPSAASCTPPRTVCRPTTPSTIKIGLRALTINSHSCYSFSCLYYVHIFLTICQISLDLFYKVS